MRLRRTTVGGPGVRRVRRGRGFSYVDANGDRVEDSDTLERIESLVIPAERGYLAAGVDVQVMPYGEVGPPAK